MRLLIFFGAGVSTRSKLPTAIELTKELFIPRSNDDAGTLRVRELLKLLLEYDTADIPRAGLYPSGEGFRASGAIYRGKASTYEDLFFLCQQIYLWCIGLSDNSQTTAFMENIERNAGDFLIGSSFDERMNDLSKLGRPACSYIESVAATTLRRNYVAGLDLLLQLATDPAIKELNIVTLNHDTLAEQFLTENGVKYVDGFGECDGDVRWSDDLLYDDPDGRVRILKLHGSVNWYDFKYDGRWKTAVLVENDPSCARNGAGDNLIAQRLSPSFLSGLNKSVSYHRGVYADVHYRFLEILRRCDRMIMSGYGWGDTAINFQLETWLDSVRRNKLLLLHENPQQLIDNSVILETSYDGWVQSGRLGIIEQWFADTCYSDVRGYLTSWNKI